MNTRFLITLFLVLTGLHLNGQETKAVKGKTNDGDKEQYFVLKDNRNVRHGLYTRIDGHSGRPVEKGYYKMGKRDSTWEEYNYDGGLAASGLYVNDKKSGVWKKYSRGEILMTVSYVDGVKQPEETYYENEQPAQTYNHATGTVTWVDSSIAELPPRYVGGMSTHNSVIARNVKYPALEKDKNIQGTVYVSFEIDSTGATSNFKVVKSVSPGLDQEALRVCALLNQWMPARKNGHPVKVQMTTPVKFVLQ